MSGQSSLQLTPTEASTPTEGNTIVQAGASSAGTVVVAATATLGTSTTTPTASAWEREGTFDANGVRLASPTTKTEGLRRQPGAWQA